MKRILARLLTAVRTPSASQAVPKVETVNVNSLRYTMPTVAADSIDYVAPTKESSQGVPQFHEDEWAQLEFFPRARFGEIQKILKEYKSFEAANRSEHGWKDIYARRITRGPVVSNSVSPGELAILVSGTLLQAPILGTFSAVLGQVENGFSIELGENAYLYGIQNESGTTVLAASLSGADDMLLTNAFASVSERFGLILVDWRQQFILVSVDENGNIDVWRP
jgi:hypothetical protein